VSGEVIWHLLGVSAELKEEFISRVALRRLTSDLDALEDVPALVDDLQRLDKAFSESAAESRHSLDDLRIVVQSVLAFRRMLGKRTLSQFAEDVTTAYAILQGLAESFDPSPKRSINFDPATVRLEMDARAEELSPHELKILANNFKELAQIIASMADNRSKATLMRRGDDVDRQLMSGDQQPHSAVDALKWMAGYLSGTQEKDDEQDE
jgi:hypothetical protein